MTAAQQLEQRGMQQGMLQGVLQGIQAKSVEIAKNMLYKLHLDMQTVAQATGLSEEELKELKNIGQ